MNTKMTNRKALTYAIDHLTDAPADVIAKLTKMVEQLDKKNASPKKLTAQQVKNEELKEVIVDFLADNADTGFTVSDLLKAIPELEGDSNQHVSALMRQLVEAGKVEKYSEKRRTYFRIVAEG
jgi:superfamily II RNA helicase